MKVKGQTIPATVRAGNGGSPSTIKAYREAIASITRAFDLVKKNPSQARSVRATIFGQTFALMNTAVINRTFRNYEDTCQLQEKHRIFNGCRMGFVFGKVEEEWNDHRLIMVFEENAIVTTQQLDTPEESIVGMCDQGIIAVLKKGVKSSFSKFKADVLKVSGEKLLDRFPSYSFHKKIMAAYFQLHNLENTSDLDTIQGTFAGDLIFLTKHHELGHTKVDEEISSWEIAADLKAQGFEEVAAELQGSLKGIIDLYLKEPVRAKRMLYYMIYDATVKKERFPYYGILAKMMASCFEDLDSAKGNLNVDKLEKNRQSLFDQTYAQIRKQRPGFHSDFFGTADGKK